MNLVDRIQPALLLSLILVACAPKPRAQSGQEFRGLWKVTERDVTFQPCGSTEEWLAEPDSTLLAGATVETTLVYVQPEPGSKAPPPLPSPELPAPHFATLRGDTSPIGKYGADGRYRRRLLVHQFGDTIGHCP
jgi:hypothetical protein